MRFLVLQHVACEPPGTFEDLLLTAGHALERVELDEGEALPSWEHFDAIVAMGGPMSVNDGDELPWLRDETAAIGAAVRAGKPYLGVCLGAQLLSAALGGTVRQGPCPEVGVLPVHMTAAAVADPVFAGLPASFDALHWHGDTFTLPHGAVLLASSEQYVHQAFRWGDRAYAVQFHVEASARLVADWLELPAYAASLRQVAGPDGAQRLLGALSDAEGRLEATARQLLARWLELIGA